MLGFGAGDEGALVAQENVLAEFNRAEEMLEGLALAAAPDEFAQRRQFWLGKRTLELEIKLDAFFAQRMSNEMLGVEARALDFPLFEIGGGGLQDFEDGHWPFVCRLSLHLE